MAHTLCDLAGCSAGAPTSSTAPTSRRPTLDARSVVVVATQGHGDEEADRARGDGRHPPIVGLVASRRRGESVLGYLADRGVPQHLLDRVRAPVGLDLGHTSHQEIAVAILAELVQLRAAGALLRRPGHASAVADARDGDRPGVRHDGHGRRRPATRSSATASTYYFCCAGCRSLRGGPGRYLTEGGLTVLIKNDFEVAQPVDKVWQFFDDIPAGGRLPAGCRAHRRPRRRQATAARSASGWARSSSQFAGTAKITERDDAAKRIVVDAAGADEKGRGQAAMTGHRAARRPRPAAPRSSVDAGPPAVRRRRAVRPRHDLGRHRRADARLRRPTCRSGSAAIERGESLDQVGDARPPSGFAHRPRGDCAWR